MLEYFPAMNLTIVDGHNLLFRAYYGSPKTVATPNGTQVNAVCRFFTFLARIARRYPNNRLFVVFDSKTGADAKKAQFPSYKSKSKKPPEGLFNQLAIIKQILDLMDVMWCEHPDYEGDDVIASLAAYWSKHNGLVCVFSDDFDFIQIMSRRVIVRRSKGHGFAHLTRDMVRENFGVRPNQYVELRAMNSSKSGCPAIHGITQAEACDALARFDNIKNIYRHLPMLPDNVATALRTQKKTLAVIRQFLTMKRDIPISEIIPFALPQTDIMRIRQPVTYYLSQLGI